MARRSRRNVRKPFWTKKRIRMVVASGFVVWVVTALATPAATYGQLLGTTKLSTHGSYTLHVPGEPPVKYSADIDYTVVGTFSVGTNNPIHMHALVYDANRSDFGALFSAIGLAFQHVALVNGPSGATLLLPYLRPAGQGEWTAEADITFTQPFNFTGPVLNPSTTPKNVSAADIESSVTDQVKAYNYPFPALQPQSYSDALSTKELELKLGATSSAVVLLVLLPLFDRSLLPKQEEEEVEDGAREHQTVRRGNQKMSAMGSGTPGFSRRARSPLRSSLLYSFI